MLKRLLVLILIGLLAFVGLLVAQDSVGVLVTDDLEIITQVDAFGLEMSLLRGTLSNQSSAAHTDINIFADLLDADGEIIGEAFGFVVDQCGTAILDFPLLRDTSRRFEASLDLFDRDAAIDAIDEIEVFIESSEVEADIAVPQIESDAITAVSNQEVVRVEWNDDSRALRYGVGCENRLFTTYDWFHYDLAGDSNVSLEANPNESFITDAFIRQTGISQYTQSGAFDDSGTLIQNSALTFPTQTRRIVYQTDLHTLITAEVDGSFKRVISNDLFQFTLQGFVWSPLGNFVAYYYGAFGDPVRYITASASGGLISGTLENNPPSMTVPGLTNDARNVITSGTFRNGNGEDITGYYLQSTLLPQQRELLFETDQLPGNNYPAPAYYRKDENTRFIYLVRPLAGKTLLQCYHREAGELHTLSELPLQLETDERAWSWLSPDFNTLAVAANGNFSGLWLVDLNAFEVCR